MSRAALVAAWLGAIVAANLSLAHFGPKIAPVNGALLVGLDLVTRDRLHDLWRGHLIRNMGALILVGSVLSYILARLLPGSAPPGDVARIAVASAVAFGLAAAADALAYHLLRHRDWYERANGSNIVGAGVDSFVFVALWPYGFQSIYALTLWAAKVGGGAVWALILSNARTRSQRTRHA